MPCYTVPAGVSSIVRRYAVPRFPLLSQSSFCRYKNHKTVFIYDFL